MWPPHFAFRECFIFSGRARRGRGIHLAVLSELTGPICARARNSHALYGLDPSGQHDWPVISAFQTGDFTRSPGRKGLTAQIRQAINRPLDS